MASVPGPFQGRPQLVRVSGSHRASSRCRRTRRPIQPASQAFDAGHPRIRGHGRVDHHAVGIRRGRAASAAERRKANATAGRALGAQQRQMREQRQPGGAALIQLGAGKGRRNRAASGWSRTRGCWGCQVCTHIPLWSPLRHRVSWCQPAACISSAKSRSGARKSLANSAVSGLTATTSVTRRKSCPLVTIWVPTSTPTSPPCTWARRLRAGPCRAHCRHPAARCAPGNRAASCSSSRRCRSRIGAMSRLPHSGRPAHAPVKPQ